MTDFSRRDFTAGTLGSLLTYSLLETLFGHDAWGSEIQPIAAKWLADANALSQDLKGQKLTQTQWQTKIEELYDKVQLAEMLKFMDFEKLAASVKFKQQGELSLQAKFPKVEGLPTSFVFGHQVFALGKGRSVVPHGHNNMATAFLILQGNFRGRHFDRLEDDGETAMIIKPTIDRAFKPGEHSSISDYKDNIHWFEATTEAAFIFNIHVMNVNPGSAKKTGRVYVDPNGEQLSGGRIRARVLGAGEAFKLYG